MRRRTTGAAGLAIAAATALTLSGTDAATATPSHSAAHSPRGTVHVSVHNHYAHVWGVASDPDTRGSVAVRVRFPSVGAKWVHTNPRTHRYSTRFWLPAGPRFLVVGAANTGAGHDTRIGSRWITVHRPETRNPRGNAHVVRAHHRATFTGHVTDPDARGKALRVLLWRNSTLVRSTYTDPRTGSYAFRHVVIRPGVNTMTVVAVNRGNGTWNTHLRRVELGRLAGWMLRYHGNRRIAAMMLPKFGWGPAQMRALNVMWNGESGWNAHAQNPSSGAYGIPQAYPAGKMASAGADWRTNPATQIRWGLRYIKARYGSPIGAWHTHLATGSY